ncbi:MAG: HIT domain-containing protein [Sedimentisphaerales bacterium]|nr:HIT domain-containing protein [Sedimentisphaerales bacterium]
MNRNNLWAPWRIGYIQGLSEKQDCFICHDVKHPAQDEDNFVLWRTERSLVVLNRFPYNNGHLLLAPVRHIAGLDELDDKEMIELTKLIVASQKVLMLAIKPGGFNVGMNFGRCAGAGLPGHMHIHIVPRWDGDTNFMAICGNTDVISQSMKDLYRQLKTISAENNLPEI